MHGATPGPPPAAVGVVGDSELVANQVNGRSEVRRPALVALHGQALAALDDFEAWSVRSVPRAENAHADRLVNPALDRAG